MFHRLYPIATRWLWSLLLAAAALAAPAVGAAQAAETSPLWVTLSPAQRQALAPLQRDWNGIDRDRKQKWLEVAARFPKLPAEERVRIQTRMTEWARLSPAERATARLQFQETRVLGSEQRQKSWQAYQALPDAERQQLAQRAKPTVAPTGEAKKPVVPASDADGSKRQAARTPTARPPQPALVQAKPGATTTTIATRAAPPVHHQPGMPKIAATSGFVDPATLLPTRGPQGAAVRSAASSDPVQQP